MSVQDEILAVCLKLQRAGTDLNYDTILAARGGGSRRDIAAALHEWHRHRAQEITSASFEMPENISDMRGEFVKVLRSAMEKELVKLRRDVALATKEIEAVAAIEINQLRWTLVEQYTESERLRAEVEYLKTELAEHE